MYFQSIDGVAVAVAAGVVVEAADATLSGEEEDGFAVEIDEDLVISRPVDGGKVSAEAEEAEEAASAVLKSSRLCCSFLTKVCT